MRRYIIVSGLVIMQVLIIVFLTWQFHMALATGTEITLMTKPDDDDMYSYELSGDYYTQYDSNFIDDDQLEGGATWNDIIYVGLTKEKGRHVVNSAHTKKPTAKAGEIILQGTYRYEDEETKSYYIEYGFEQISHIDSYGAFKNSDRLQVTFRYAEKWNQFKVLDVTKVK